MSGCRIARVRHKASGKTIEVISAPKRPEIADLLVRAAAEIASTDGWDLAGFFVVGVNRDGTYRAGWRLLDDAPYGPTLFTPFIAEIARREVVVNTEVETFCVRQGWLAE
jgi:hypothetical protein